MVIGHESLEKRMESIVDGIAQQAEGIALLKCLATCRCQPPFTSSNQFLSF